MNDFDYAAEERMETWNAVVAAVAAKTGAPEDKIAAWLSDELDASMDNVDAYAANYLATHAAAVALGRRGGSAKSERKARTSAANGRNGGRPRKTATPEGRRELAKRIYRAAFPDAGNLLDIVIEEIDDWLRSGEPVTNETVEQLAAQFKEERRTT